MTVIAARVTFHIPGAHSLKDKRQVAKSLVDKTRRRFNVSLAEVDTQQAHQLLTLGIAAVSSSGRYAQGQLDEAIRFMESNTDAELTSVEFMQ